MRLPDRPCETYSLGRSLLSHVQVRAHTHTRDAAPVRDAQRLSVLCARLSADEQPGQRDIRRRHERPVAPLAGCEVPGLTGREQVQREGVLCELRRT